MYACAYAITKSENLTTSFFPNSKLTPQNKRLVIFINRLENSGYPHPWSRVSRGPLLQSTTYSDNNDVRESTHFFDGEGWFASTTHHVAHTSCRKLRDRVLWDKMGLLIMQARLYPTALPYPRNPNGPVSERILFFLSFFIFFVACNKLQVNTRSDSLGGGGTADVRLYATRPLDVQSTTPTYRLSSVFSFFIVFLSFSSFLVFPFLFFLRWLLC